MDGAAGYLTDREDFIREKVSEQSFKWLPKWIDKIIAGRLIQGLIKAAEEMRAPDHPWRLELAEAVQGFVARLEHDPRASETLAAWRAQRDGLRALHRDVLDEPIPDALLRAASETGGAQALNEDKRILID